MKSSLKYIVVLDTETGGLFNSKVKAFDDAALIEVACVVIDCQELKIVEELSWILKPYKDDLIYSKEAEAVHGITKEVIENNGLEEKIVFKQFKQLLSKYKNPRHKAAICGHNLNGFDLEFIRNWFTFHNEDWESLIKWTFDTQAFAYMASDEQENYQLHTCCQNAGIDLVNAHRALDDTKATADLMIKYIEKLKGKANPVVEIEKKPRYREKFQLL